ncbi:hypothetical protein Pelo_17662 [Pelomyxa schiedti]|nr:hypothetical protein Pelo_17662 [Pelomyxa schiedti]
MLPLVIKAFRAFETTPTTSVIVAAGRCLRLFVLEAHIAQATHCGYHVSNIKGAVEYVFSRWARVSPPIYWLQSARSGPRCANLLPEIDSNARAFCSFFILLAKRARGHQN